MKTPTRFPIFNYNTFASTLVTDTKTLEIKLRNKFISLETLFELESMLAWCASHPEIQSIYFTVYGEEFIQGIAENDLKSYDHDKIKKIHSKVSTIAQSFFCLPQTIVMDLKNGTKGIGVEIALAADIRISAKNATFTLDHLSLGLTPSCGMFSFLSPYINQNVARSLLLSGKNFSVDTFNSLGGWIETDLSYKEVLLNIFKQAPVARMQAKRGLLGENFTKDVNEKIKLEQQIFNATLATDDYKETTGNFMNHQDFKQKLETSILE